MIARKRSEEIDKQLDALAKERPRILKILLLGAGESGMFFFFVFEIYTMRAWNFNFTNVISISIGKITFSSFIDTENKL